MSKKKEKMMKNIYYADKEHTVVITYTDVVTTS